MPGPDLNISALTHSESEKFSSIELEITRDINSLGIADKIRQEIQKKTGKPGILPAALSVLRSVGPKNATILLVTGYPVPYPFSSKREIHSDGPIGVASLVKTFQALNVNTVLLTDEGLGHIAQSILEALKIDNRTTPVLEFQKNSDPAEQAKEILSKVNPSAIISSEKISMNSDGIYHTALGDDLSSYVAPTDFIFTEAKKNKRITTVGIGDFGNEIGMGLISDSLPAILPNRGRCKCGCRGGVVAKTVTDSLIAGTMSDWGVYGLIGALALLTHRFEILPKFSDCHKALKAFARETNLVSEYELMTDNIPIKETQAIIKKISYLVKNG